MADDAIPSLYRSPLWRQPANAATWFGAGKVIITTRLFPDVAFAPERLTTLARRAGRERLVVDSSCRHVGDGWLVAMARALGRQATVRGGGLRCQSYPTS